MSYEWLMAPHEYEPDYDAYWRDLESLETIVANVGSYDDWFPDLHKANGSRTFDALYQVCASQWARDLWHLKGKFGPPVYTR